MKILYLDCGMGAAGDMLTAALLELLPEPDKFIDELNALGIPGVRYIREKESKCGIVGTHISVTVDGVEENENMHAFMHEEHSHENEAVHSHDHENEYHHHEHDHDHTHTHTHNCLSDIEHIVKDQLKLKDEVASNILKVYGLIAEAESRVHGKPVSEIHFHEVGTMDAIADVTAVCMLIDRIAADRIVASPVHVGSGQVKCAHGILPVPAPATAYILRDVPIYGGEIKGELCTPTGAAILKCFADEFSPMPVLKTQKIGYGMGKKDFDRANCVRAIIGYSDEPKGEIIELACNLDDMTGESIGFAMDILLKNGALDVFTQNIGMKKSRPGIILSILCREGDRELMTGLVFKYTSTLGIREYACRRYTLNREIVTEKSNFGDIRKKVSSGYGVTKEKYEYDDLCRIAQENNITIDEVLKGIRRM